MNSKQALVLLTAAALFLFIDTVLLAYIRKKKVFITVLLRDIEINFVKTRCYAYRELQLLLFFSTKNITFFSNLYTVPTALFSRKSIVNTVDKIKF